MTETNKEKSISEIQADFLKDFRGMKTRIEYLERRLEYMAKWLETSPVKYREFQEFEKSR
jgi:hypothetical protein